MNPIDIINAHRQKYRNSCSPSLCEMLLKLAGIAKSDYYVEQDRDKDQNVGLSNILGKTVLGCTFHKVASGSPGEFEKRVDEILQSGRFLGIYLPLGGSFHGYVIVGRANGHYLLLTKGSEQGNGEGKITIPMLVREQDLPILSKFDCIHYERCVGEQRGGN